MADTSSQREVVKWVRENWLPAQFGQTFEERKLRLSPGGEARFSAVSADGNIAAFISTSDAKTANGRNGVGKMTKLRSDMLFLVMAGRPRSLVVLTEPEMYDQCCREKAAGRVPSQVEFVLAELPDGLHDSLHSAREVASREVTPIL